MRWGTLAALGLIACGGGGKDVKPADGPGGPPGRNGPTQNVPEPGLPKAVGKDGIVFSWDGKPLELRVLKSGTSEQVDDGTPLTLVSEQSGEGFGRADAEVIIKGQDGLLPNNAVLVGDRLRTSPSSRIGIFIATRECQPHCVSEVWALHHDGRRLRITTALTRPTAAFSPDGTQVAIGGGEGMYLLTALTWKAFNYKEFSAPAFAYDNTLYVRAHGASDELMRMFSGGQVTVVASEPGTPTDPIPQPVTFADSGKTIVVTFERAGGDKTTRVPR